MDSRRRCVLWAFVLAGRAAAWRQARRREPRDVLGETEKVRRFYNRVAPRYDRAIRLVERALLGDGRRWVASHARGATLEIAIGTGRNLPYYPDSVRLVGIDLSPAMLALAEERARRLDRPVELQVGDAQSLAFPDESFETVVSTLSLCTIPDPERAVREAARVLRPGGRLVLLEHVRSPHLIVRGVQHLLEPLTVRLEHDHLLREPLTYVQAAGLIVERLERSRLGLIERMVARKPE
jgi:ubiquinone/menaquinone biosynthesis C-methylase UbiE